MRPEKLEQEIIMEEKEQKAKGRSLWIFLLIQLAVPALLFLFFDIGGLAIWAFGGVVIIPLQLIVGAKVSRKIAEAMVFDPSDVPSGEYTAAMDAGDAGITLGAVHAGAGVFRELKKPGWIKDSKKV